MTWFDRGGEQYAAFRPSYPESVADLLANAAPDRGLAVDVGCGTGQFTALLARRFDRVIGLDPGQTQLDNAIRADNIDYRLSSAEDLDVPDGVASLVTAAQSAHWFDLPAYYREVRRIAVPGAVTALLSYGVVHLDDDLAERFDTFYRDEIGHYWPPERIHVDEGYARMEFPFDRIELKAPAIQRDWTLDEFVGYLGTWSASMRARDAGRGDLLDSLRADLAPAWGEGRRRVRWPLTVIAGLVS